MSAGMEFTSTVFDSLNAASNMVEDYNHKTAQLSTQSKQIKLQAAINAELDRIKRSGSYENWNTDITSFFEKVKNGMGDKNSPYYCKNNLQAQMFEGILNQNQVSVSEKVSQMVFGAERDHAIVDYTNNLELLAQTTAGDDYVRQANEGAKLLFNSGFINESQLQKQYDQNYSTAYSNAATKLFNESVQEAIKRGEKEEALIAGVFSNMPMIMPVDTAGLPKAFDRSAMDEALKKTFKQDYKAYLYDYQQGNAEKLSEINQQMRKTQSAEDRLAVARRGQSTLSRMTGNMLSEDDRNKYAAYFDYEIKDITGGSGSGGSSALKKMNPKDRMEFYMNAIRNGDETTVNDARRNFEKEILEEFRAYTGDESATIIDVEKAYPIVGQFFEYAKKNLPYGFDDVISTAENVLKSTLNTKGDNDKYKEEFSSTMGLVTDLLFDTRLKGAGPEEIKAVKNRFIRALNANLGGVLEKNKAYKDAFEDYAGIEKLSNYKQGVFESREERMAKAIVERDDNPDLVYTNYNGVEVPYALQEGLSRLENDERTELKEQIKMQTGQDVKDGDIKMTYEKEEGRDDVSARRIYTINKIDYRFRSEDGKHIILESKENGTKDWHVIRTASQQKEYDSPQSRLDRVKQEKNLEEIPKEGISYTDENGKTAKITYENWKRMEALGRDLFIKDWLSWDPDAAQKWLDSLPDKKKK
ncbi:MAG: hypothetical protein K6D95_04660 [Treponema sp.]|nr:hypothetical protein [Treponema sp.]